LQQRTNPCVIPTGYAFCYPCIVQYLRSHHCCPITRAPVDEEAIVRLYDTGS
jgi:hypothetical protein